MTLRQAVGWAALSAAFTAAAQTSPTAPAPASTPAPPPAPAPAPAPPAPQRIEITGETQNDTDVRRRDPVARTVYGREELDKYGDISVTDVLKRLPGINLSGGTPRMRGLGAGYTLILINGEPAPPGFSLENLPPSQVERIEVTKGVTADRSTQAVAGTINIILRAAPKQRQRELSVRVGYSALRPTGGFNATLADRFDELSVSLPLSGYQWAGITPNQTLRVTRDDAGALQTLAVDGEDRWSGGGLSLGPRLSWKPNDALTVESQTFVQRNEFRTDSAYRTQVLAGSTPVSVDDVNAFKGYWQMLRTGLTLTRKRDDGARLEARLGVQATDNTGHNQMFGRDGQAVQTVERHSSFRNAEQSRTSSGKFTQPLGEAHTLATGWDVEQKNRREVRDAFENGLPQLLAFEGEPFYARVTRLAAYVQDEWEIAPQWGSYLGARIESIATRSQSSTGTLDARSQVLTPVLHLTHKLDAKGRDLLRGSLTRAYRAPELSSLLARPSINSTYPATGGNAENAPDRVGNPTLKPELSTGLDFAYEHYFAAGGVMSIGLFHRQIEGLIRNSVTLDEVSWSPVPRWVSHPVNLQGARSTGIEFEIKGRAVDLLGAAAVSSGDLQLRGSLSAYTSSVTGLPGPDNRLEQQQPWSLNLGLDDKRFGGLLGYGVSLAWTPGYTTQQTVAQSQYVNRSRNLDAYLALNISRETTARLSVNNLRPPSSLSDTRTTEDSGNVLRNRTVRQSRAQWTASLAMKF